MLFFCWAIGGETNVYPKASKEQLKVHGYYTQVPGQESLKPCTTTYSKLSSSYQIFLPQLLLAIPLTYKKDARVHGIPTHKYMLGDNALKVNNVTVFTRGIFDVSRLFGGPLYVSLPRFFHADKSLHKELTLPSPRQNKHSSFVSISGIYFFVSDFISFIDSIILHTARSQNQKHDRCWLIRSQALLWKYKTLSLLSMALNMINDLFYSQVKSRFSWLSFT